MASQQQLVYNIARYLTSLKDQEGVNGENIDIITNLLETSFDIDNSPENFKSLAFYPVSLVDIFSAGVEKLNLQSTDQEYQKIKGDAKFENFVEVVSKKGFFEGTEVGSVEYLERQAKLVAKYKERALKAESAVEENEKKAEEKKVQGNAAISAKEYETAIELYTEALALSPDGPNAHIYYSNRAAAYTFLGDHQHAVDDCEASLLLKGDYAKAYSRLGLSYYHLGRYEESVAAFEHLVELEPDNKASKEELRKARKKLDSTSQKQAATVKGAGTPSSSAKPDLSALASMMGGGGDDSGAPGLAGLMNNPMMKQAMDKAGGPAGIANLMKDPSMMAMAQQVMQNPALMQQAMQMMGGGAGGAGGMPDLSSLAGLMGGAGGAGVPSSSSSSSSSKKGKQPFRGFEDN